jgi:hypothetical protein
MVCLAVDSNAGARATIRSEIAAFSDLLSVFRDGQAAPTPVLEFNLLDDHEGRRKRLVEDVKQQLADPRDQGCFLLAGRAIAARTRPFPCYLYCDDWHWISP